MRRALISSLALGLVLWAALGATALGSAGCLGGRSSDEIFLAPGDHREEVTVSGATRACLIHVPPAVTDASDGTGARLPLVIFLAPAAFGDDSERVKAFGFDALADREGFVVAYPDGFPNTTFVDVLLKRLQAILPIDKDRTYATGYSNGGVFAYHAAYWLPGRFAAIASVAAPMDEPLADAFGRAHPTSVAIIMGTEDPVLPWMGSPGIVVSVARTVLLWVKADGCAEEPSVSYLPDTDPNDGTLVREERHAGGRKGTEVVLFAIEGGGHSWPGLPAREARGRSSRDVSATELIWAFFEEHPGQ